MTKLTSASFREGVAQGLTLVDFYADWCGPCKALAPAIEALAQEWAGRAQVAKLNVDESPDVAAAFGVMSIPTLVVFRDGEEVARSVGLSSKAALNRLLEANL